jgi:Beta-catenin-interacting protein ICAT
LAGFFCLFGVLAVVVCVSELYFSLSLLFSLILSFSFSLLSSFGSVQLAIQAAISSAFKAPEVIRLFAKRDNSSLRDRLSALSASQKLGKISEDQYNAQASEVLLALKKLGAGVRCVVSFLLPFYHFFCADHMFDVCFCVGFSSPFLLLLSLSLSHLSLIDFPADILAGRGIPGGAPVAGRLELRHCDGRTRI